MFLDVSDDFVNPGLIFLATLVFYVLDFLPVLLKNILAHDWIEQARDVVVAERIRQELSKRLLSRYKQVLVVNGECFCTKLIELFSQDCNHHLDICLIFDLVCLHAGGVQKILLCFLVNFVEICEIFFLLLIIKKN